jgi:hypothetical protein
MLFHKNTGNLTLENIADKARVLLKKYNVTLLQGQKLKLLKKCCRNYIKEVKLSIKRKLKLVK